MIRVANDAFEHSIQVVGAGITGISIGNYGSDPDLRSAVNAGAHGIARR
jgi:hypothetical protein